MRNVPLLPGEHHAVLAVFLAGMELEGWQFGPARNGESWHACPRCGLDELRGILSDLLAESNLYHAGLETGRKEERERCAGIVTALARREQEAAEEYPLSARLYRNAISLLAEVATEIAHPARKAARAASESSCFAP